MTGLRLLFLIHSTPTGGHVTFVQRALEYLAPHADLAVADETPERVIDGLPSAVRPAVGVWPYPLWSDRGRAARDLTRRLESWSPDWVVLDNPGLLVIYGAVLRRARRRCGTRLQFTVHSGVFQMTPRRRLLEALAALALLGMDRIICVSQFTRQYWVRRYHWLKRMDWEVVHNGVPVPRDLPPTPNRRLQVGFVGRLDREKDPILFCQTAQHAMGAGLAADFHVFGDGDLGPELQRSYRDHVRFHGRVRDAEGIYPLTDVLLVTSPVENCPYSVLEAKSFGVPSVSARIGGVPEIVQHGVDGVLCAERSRVALTTGLQEIAANLEHFRQGCLANRYRFTLDAQGERLWAPLLRARSQAAGAGPTVSL